MVATDARYFGRRAEHLAQMYLTRTRRSDFLVQKQTSDYGLDLLIDIADSSGPTARLFAVQIRATDLRGVLVQDDGTLREKWPNNARTALENVPFPVCVFSFIMRERDDAYYAWLKAPVSEGGEATLALDLNPLLLCLDDIALERIKTEVSSWYAVRAKLNP